jgi:3-oxoadipate enol-lactonase
MSNRNTSESGVVTTNGAQLSYQTAGTGEPFLLLHAGVADSRMWDVQFETFAQYYRVITYDLRGYGNSKMPDLPFAHHQDLTALLDHLEIESTHLLGASAGGAVALNFALEHPERVRTLSLAGAAVDGYRFTDRSTLERWEEAGTALEEEEYEQAAEIESEMWLAGPNRNLSQLDPELRKLLQDMLLRRYDISPDEDQENEQELQPPAVSRLDEVEAPTLVLVGNQDRADILTIADMLTEQVPDAKQTIISGTAHLLNLERPDLFDQHVLGFVEARSTL